LPNERRIRIQEAQKHADPVDPDSDPDPQHCLEEEQWRPLLLLLLSLGRGELQRRLLQVHRHVAEGGREQSIGAINETKILQFKVS
jgi:hypothetical protein